MAASSPARAWSGRARTRHTRSPSPSFTACEMASIVEADYYLDRDQALQAVGLRE